MLARAPIAVRLWPRGVLRLNVTPVRMKLGLLATILRVNPRVVLAPLQPLEQVVGHPRVLLAPLVCIRRRRTSHRVLRVPPVPLQILEPALGHPRVLLVPLVCIRCRRTSLRVPLAPPFPTPPLSNAPLVPIKQLQRATQAIMDPLAMHHVENVAPVPSQTLEQTLGQQRVLFVPLVSIPWLPPLVLVRPVPPLPTPPLSNVRILPIKKLQRVTQGITGFLAMPLVKNVVPVPLQILGLAPGPQSVFGMTQDAHQGNIQTQPVL